jgi:hypothetical protein
VHLVEAKTAKNRKQTVKKNQKTEVGGPCVKLKPVTFQLWFPSVFLINLPKEKNVEAAFKKSLLSSSMESRY